ncbi:MAG TPA: Stp1/IreP family PP2C-type Ser/Thr phosphatase [Chloroflexia bacterium]|nr:Stp1/IreP family PP2C-type Ser/Thr phosphatase [Chloroflexia bacterium]
MLKLTPVALTNVGRKRSNNQDYLGDLIFKSGRKYGPEKLEERGYLFAVADGMGGYAGGEVASELAITTLFEHYYNAPSSGDIANDLSEAVREANYQVHETASSTGRNQMGTTLTLVLIKGNKAIFGNVGDSRTYLIRQGIPERVTHDHSLVQDQIDAGVLTPEQAEKSSIRNFITRAIGHRDEVESDLFERDILPGDILLLCSDGLHGLVKELEMGTIVATTPNLQEAAQQLVDMANERGGPDNISVMLIRVDSVGEALPPILNGREASYNHKGAIYNQSTTQLQNLNGQTGVMDVLPAAAPPPVAPDMPTVPQRPVIPESQVTTPMRVGSENPKSGGKGIILGLIVLILIAGAVIAFILLSGSNSNPAPATTPTTQPTATATATINVTMPPTITPLPGTPGTGASLPENLNQAAAASRLGAAAVQPTKTGIESSHVDDSQSRPTGSEGQNAVTTPQK